MAGKNMSWVGTAVSMQSRKCSYVDLSHFNQNGLQVYEGNYGSSAWYPPVMKLT